MTEKQGDDLLALAAQQYTADQDIAVTVHQTLVQANFHSWILVVVACVLVVGLVAIAGLLKPRSGG